MIALGVMSHEDELGMEASGVVRRCGHNVKDLHPGDKLMVCKPGLFRTRAVVPRERCSKSPSFLSLEDAASMPVVYSTAYYCLIEMGRLEKGQVRENLTMNVEYLISKLTFIVYLNPCSLWRSWFSCHTVKSNGWGKCKYRQRIFSPCFKC